MCTDRPEAVEQTRALALAALATGPLRFADLFVRCGLVEGERTTDGVSSFRVLDAALQALRRSGAIEFTAAGWQVKP